MPTNSDEIYIYIPGLGDRLTWGRKLLIWLFWRNKRVEVFSSRWNDRSESAAEKKARLKQMIDRYADSRLVLVGESAGGSLAILTAMEYSDRARFVTVCGYNHHQASINKVHQQTHPAFYELVGELDQQLASLPEQVAEQSLVLYSSGDGVVDRKYTLIDGVSSRELGDLQHNMAIIRVLTDGSYLG